MGDARGCMLWSRQFLPGLEPNTRERDGRRSLRLRHEGYVRDGRSPIHLQQALALSRLICYT